MLSTELRGSGSDSSLDNTTATAALLGSPLQAAVVELDDRGLERALEKLAQAINNMRNYEKTDSHAGFGARDPEAVDSVTSYQPPVLSGAVEVESTTARLLDRRHSSISSVDGYNSNLIKLKEACESVVEHVTEVNFATVDSQTGKSPKQLLEEVLDVCIETYRANNRPALGYQISCAVEPIVKMLGIRSLNIDVSDRRMTAEEVAQAYRTELAKRLEKTGAVVALDAVAVVSTAPVSASGSAPVSGGGGHGEHKAGGYLFVDAVPVVPSQANDSAGLLASLSLTAKVLVTEVSEKFLIKLMQTYNTPHDIYRHLAATQGFSDKSKYKEIKKHIAHQLCDTLAGRIEAVMPHPFVDSIRDSSIVNITPNISGWGAPLDRSFNALDHLVYGMIKRRPESVASKSAADTVVAQTQRTASKLPLSSQQSSSASMSQKDSQKLMQHAIHLFALGIANGVKPLHTEQWFLDQFAGTFYVNIDYSAFMGGLLLFTLRGEMSQPGEAVYEVPSIQFSATTEKNALNAATAIKQAFAQPPDLWAMAHLIRHYQPSPAVSLSFSPRPEQRMPPKAIINQFASLLATPEMLTTTSDIKALLSYLVGDQQIKSALTSEAATQLLVALLKGVSSATQLGVAESKDPEPTQQSGTVDPNNIANAVSFLLSFGAKLSSDEAVASISSGIETDAQPLLAASGVVAVEESPVRMIVNLCRLFETMGRAIIRQMFLDLGQAQAQALSAQLSAVGLDRQFLPAAFVNQALFAQLESGNFLGITSFADLQEKVALAGVGAQTVTNQLLAKAVERDQAAVRLFRALLQLNSDDAAIKLEHRTAVLASLQALDGQPKIDFALSLVLPAADVAGDAAPVAASSLFSVAERAGLMNALLVRAMESRNVAMIAQLITAGVNVTPLIGRVAEFTRQQQEQLIGMIQNFWTLVSADHLNALQPTAAGSLTDNTMAFVTAALRQDRLPEGQLTILPAYFRTLSADNVLAEAGRLRAAGVEFNDETKQAIFERVLNQLSAPGAAHVLLVNALLAIDLNAANRGAGEETLLSTLLRMGIQGAETAAAIHFVYQTATSKNLKTLSDALVSGAENARTLLLALIETAPVEGSPVNLANDAAKLLPSLFQGMIERCTMAEIGAVYEALPGGFRLTQESADLMLSAVLAALVAPVAFPAAASMVAAGGAGGDAPAPAVVAVSGESIKQCQPLIEAALLAGAGPQQLVENFANPAVRGALVEMLAPKQKKSKRKTASTAASDTKAGEVGAVALAVSPLRAALQPLFPLLLGVMHDCSAREIMDVAKAVDVSDAAHKQALFDVLLPKMGQEQESTGKVKAKKSSKAAAVVRSLMLPTERLALLQDWLQVDPVLPTRHLPAGASEAQDDVFALFFPMGTKVQSTATQTTKSLFSFSAKPKIEMRDVHSVVKAVTEFKQQDVEAIAALFARVAGVISPDRLFNKIKQHVLLNLNESKERLPNYSHSEQESRNNERDKIIGAVGSVQNLGELSAALVVQYTGVVNMVSVSGLVGALKGFVGVCITASSAPAAAASTMPLFASHAGASDATVVSEGLAAPASASASASTHE